MYGTKHFWKQIQWDFFTIIVFITAMILLGKYKTCSEFIGMCLLVQKGRQMKAGKLQNKT